MAAQAQPPTGKAWYRPTWYRLRCRVGNTSMDRSPPTHWLGEGKPIVVSNGSHRAAPGVKIKAERRNRVRRAIKWWDGCTGDVGAVVKHLSW